MPNRYPLIANPSTSQIQELASGDNIDLSGNDIVGVVDITATGNISTSGSIVAGGVSYPTALGSDGQVLTSDGAGGTAWEDSSVSGLPSGDAGESLVFRGDTWVISPQNFDVATNNFDSDWNSVQLMIPFDSETGQSGTAGWETPIYGSIGGYGATPGTSFTASGISEVVETVGNVALSSTGAKFGSNSVRFTGQTTGYIEFSDMGGNQDKLVEIGSGNFTMEFWFKVDHLNWIQDIVSVLGTSGTYTNGCWTFRTQTSGSLYFHDELTGIDHQFLDGTTNNQIVADTWYHVAISRDNNVLRLFLDGVEKQEVVVTTDFTLDANSKSASACLRFGAGQPNQINGMEGNIDDFRITKGAARYLASFTPPTQGFANTGTVVYGDITYPLSLHTDVDLVTSVPTNGQVFTWDATGGPSNNGAWVAAGILNGLVTSTATDVTFTGDLNINYDEKITIGGGVAGSTHSMCLYSETSGFKYNYLQGIENGLKIRSDDGAGNQGSDIDLEIGTELFLKVHNSGVRLCGGTGGAVKLESVSTGVEVTGDLDVTGSITLNGSAINASGASDLIEEGNTSVETIDTGTDGTIKFETEGTDRWKITSGGHIIPYANAAYDIGNAEYKVRHLFLSDNSLWVGDEHKVSTEGGKMKFKKRKKSVVPSVITTAGGNEAGLLSSSSKASLDLVTLEEALAYLTSLDANKIGVSDLYPPEGSGGYTNDDYDEIINQHGPGKYPAPITSSGNMVQVDLFAGDTYGITAPTANIQLDIIGADPIVGNTIDLKVYVLQGETEYTVDSVVINGQTFNSSIRVVGALVPNVWQLFEFNAIYVSDGSGGYEWVSIIKVDVVAGGGSGATINNNADNRLITGSGTAGTLEAESSLTYDGTKLNLGDDKKITFGSNLRMEIYTDGSNNYIQLPADGGGAFPLIIKSNAIDALKINSTGNLEDSKGDVRSLGGTGNITTAYTITDRSYVGRVINTTADVAVNGGALSNGDAITVYNNSSSAISITQGSGINGSGVALLLAGTNSGGDRTLAGTGIATILCIDDTTNNFVVIGAGVT